LFITEQTPPNITRRQP
jgi:hypothetical protein